MQQTSIKFKTIHDVVEKSIHWELCKKLIFDHTAKWYMQKPESVRDNETHTIFRDLEIQTDHLILARRPDQVIINNKKRAFRMIDFSVLADYSVKIKESRKSDKSLDFARELKKKLWNMKMTVIPIVISTLGSILKDLMRWLEVLEIGGWAETIQTTALLKSPGILRRVLVTWGDLLLLRL